MTLANIYGLDVDKLPLSRTTALQIAAVSKGRNVITSTIGRLPLEAKRYGVTIPNQPSMFKQFQNGVPNYQFLVGVIDHMLFFGHAFLLITEREYDGRPRSFVFVPEGKSETDEYGELVRAFGRDVPKGGYVRIDAGHDGILTTGRDVLNAAKELERLSREAGAGVIPNIVLKQSGGYDYDADEVAAIRATFLALRKQKGGSIAFAGPDIDVQQMGQRADDLLIAGLNNSAIEIARLMNLPAWAIDAEIAGSSLTYSNSTSRMKEFLDWSAMPYMFAIESLFSMLLPNGQTAEFDTSTLLRGDFAERMAAYSVAVTSGIYTIEELREFEGLDPIIPGEVTELPPVPAPTEVAK